MNYTTAVFLINASIRAVRVAYEPGEGSGKNTIFKTLDPLIKKDDFVVVPTKTRHGMTVVKVEEVDVTVDYDSATPMEWIVSVVNKAPYEEVLKQEEIAITEIKTAEEHRKRTELQKSLTAINPSKFASLQLAALNEDGTDKIAS
jgi:hypothetical protein